MTVRNFLQKPTKIQSKLLTSKLIITWLQRGTKETTSTIVTYVATLWSVNSKQVAKWTHDPSGFVLMLYFLLLFIESLEHAWGLTNRRYCSCPLEDRVKGFILSTLK